MLFATDPAASFGFVFATIAGLLLIAAWVILASSRFVQGGSVERSDRVPQLYGYTACLIGLVWALTSAVSLIDNALTISAPELRSESQFGMEPSVSSFEAFRATYDRARQFSSPESRPTRVDSIPEPELRRRYEALRADRIHRGRFETRRAITKSAVSFAIAAIVFLFHWRWLRNRTMFAGVQ